MGEHFFHRLKFYAQFDVYFPVIFVRLIKFNGE